MIGRARAGDCAGWVCGVSIARTFAAQEREPWGANREMVSQGWRTSPPVLGGVPGRWFVQPGSLNKLAGASSWAGAITGAFVLLALPLTPLLEDLPEAILGAVVLGAVIKLVRLDALFELARSTAGAGGAGTFAATLVSAPRVERGVLVGVGLALFAQLYRELKVASPFVRVDNTLTIAPEGVLWFATVSGLERQIRAHSAQFEELERVVLDLAGVGRLDYTAAAALRRVVEEMRDADIVVEIVNVQAWGNPHLFD